MKNQPIILVLFVLIALTTIHTGHAWENSATIDTTRTFDKFSSDIWGVNFDNNQNFFNRSDLQLLNKNLGVNYVRIWIPRNTNFMFDASMVTNFSNVTSAINDVYNSGGIPYFVFGGLSDRDGIDWMGNDSTYSGAPNRYNFTEYVQTFLDHYNLTYNISTWYIELLNEPDLAYGTTGANISNYTLWFNYVVDNLTARYPQQKFGGPVVSYYAWFDWIPRFIRQSTNNTGFISYHTYGASGDPNSVSNETFINATTSLGRSGYGNGRNCTGNIQNWKPAPIECILSEWNWASGNTGDGRNYDPRQYDRFAGTWTASALVEIINGSINKTFMYEDMGHGFGIMNFTGSYATGSFHTWYQYDVLQTLNNYTVFGGDTYKTTSVGNTTENFGIVVFDSNHTSYQFIAMIVNRKNISSALNLTVPLMVTNMTNIKNGTVYTRNSPRHLDITIGGYDILYLGFNGTDTWDGTSNEGCVSFEPLGSCPETTFPLRPAVSYTNTIREDTNNIYFDYNSSNENITYTILKNILINNTPAYYPFWGTRAKIELYSNNKYVRIYSPSGYDPFFEFTNNTGERVGKWAYEINRNITNWSIAGNSLFITYDYNFMVNSSGNTGELIDQEETKYNITIKGKSLLIRATSKNGKYRFATIDNVALDQEAPIRNYVNDFYSTYTQRLNDMLVINNSAFYKIAVILDKSNMSNIYQTTLNNNSNTSRMVYYTGIPQYQNKTDGLRNNQDDTIAFTISITQEDLFVNTKYNKTSTFESLKNTWMYEMIDDYTGANYLNDINNVTNRYYNYGFDMSNSILTSFSAFSTPNPDRTNFSSGFTLDIVRSLASNLSSKGIKWGTYNSLQDIYPVSIFYNNSMYGSYNINGSNFSYCMRYTNSTLMNAWYESVYGGYACAGKWERRYDQLQYQWNNITSNWNQNLLYLDTEGAMTFTYVDKDATSEQNGSVMNQFMSRIKYYDWIRSRGLFTYTENHDSFATTGLIDIGEMTKNCCSNESDMGNVPNYELMLMNNKYISVQGYLRRFIKNWNNTGVDYGTFASDESQFDRYIVTGIAEGRIAHLDGEWSGYHNLPDNKTIEHYYSMREIGKRYIGRTIVNISYVNVSNSQYLSFSQATLQNYSYYNPIIFESWSNGLQIYANLNRTGWWNFSANGKSINLPPNGLYAYITNDTSFEECFNCEPDGEGNLSTKVITPDYVYIYVKDGQSHTFSLPNNYYTANVFYGDDQSNGRRIVYSSSTSISTYTTDTTSILYPTNSDQKGMLNFGQNLYIPPSVWYQLTYIMVILAIGMTLLSIFLARRDG